MKRIKAILYRIFKPKIMDECLKSAYEDFQYLLENVFTNLFDLGFTLTFEEFESVFEKYDWREFIDGLEDLENSDLIRKDVYQISELLELLILLIDNNIDCKWDNSYFIEYIYRD